MGPGDLVILLADPLKYGGELLIVQVTPDGRLVCEAVHWDGDDPSGDFDEHGAERFPPRIMVDPHQVELASVWARKEAA